MLQSRINQLSNTPACVLHVAQSFDLCGRSRMIYDLCVGLRGRGFQSEVAILCGAAGFVQNEVPTVVLGRREGFDAALLFRLARLIKRGGISILHSHGRGAAVYAALAGLLARPGLWIHTVHRSDGDRISGRTAVNALVLNRVHAVAFVSDAARSEFERVHGWRSDKSRVIYNGISIERFESAPRPRASVGPVFGAVANLSPDKDFETLLRAFASLSSQRSAARLVIVGDGPSAGEVKRLTAELGLAGRVEITGFRDDVPSLLRSFDVLVHSTRTEGLGIAILEAMASRVPVVATAVGGIPEIVRDGVTGRLVPAGDAAALCKAMTAAVHDKDQSAAMAVAALDEVRARFSVEAMCSKYAALYRGDRIVAENRNA